MIISAHWIGCLFFFTCELQEQTGGSPWCAAQDDIRDGTGPERLLIAFHTAFLMLIGENIGPTSPVEYAYTVLALIVGQIISDSLKNIFGSLEFAYGFAFCQNNGSLKIFQNVLWEKSLQKR